jgi:hypothetical protein
MRALLLATILLPTVAWAQPPALHPKAWYAEHDGARIATLHWCHSDATHADLFDCQNAEAADAGKMIGAGPPRTMDQYLNDPNYWVQNPFARYGAMVQCNRRGPGDELVLPFCPAIRAGDALARGKRN